MPWNRYLPERFPAMSTAIVMAAMGFFVLQRGTSRGASAVAYAEAVHHEVSPLSTGRVKEIYVRVGQRVRRGDVIALMDDRPLVATRERTRAEIEKRRAEVAAALLEQESRVTRSELAVLRARAEEQGDRARLEELSRQMARLDDLLERKMIPATDVESAHEKAHELAARVSSYDRARAAGSAPAAGTQRSTLDARIEPYRRAVAVQEAVLADVERAIEDLTLRAPVDGAVTTVWRHPGDVAAAATPIATIVDGRAGLIVAIVPEGAQLGTHATVRRKPLFSRSFEGEVVEVAPEIEEVPVRARSSPTVPAWGRRAFIQLAEGTELVPGEALHVTLR